MPRPVAWMDAGTRRGAEPCPHLRWRPSPSSRTVPSCSPRSRAGTTPATPPPRPSATWPSSGTPSRSPPSTPRSSTTSPRPGPRSASTTTAGAGSTGPRSTLPRRHRRHELDVIILVGVEPQLRWRTFCEQVSWASPRARRPTGRHPRRAAGRGPPHPPDAVFGAAYDDDVSAALEPHAVALRGPHRHHRRAPRRVPRRRASAPPRCGRPCRPTCPARRRPRPRSPSSSAAAAPARASPSTPTELEIASRRPTSARSTSWSTPTRRPATTSPTSRRRYDDEPTASVTSAEPRRRGRALPPRPGRRLTGSGRRASPRQGGCAGGRRARRPPRPGWRRRPGRPTARRRRSARAARPGRTSRRRRSRAGAASSSPPMARQWNTSEYSGMRVKPRRRPSSTAMSCTTSHSMPVSSCTSFTATSAGRVADVGPARSGTARCPSRPAGRAGSRPRRCRRRRRPRPSGSRSRPRPRRPTSSTRATSVVGVEVGCRRATRMSAATASTSSNRSRS